MFTLQQQYASETVVFFIVNDVDIINKIPNPKLNINNFFYTEINRTPVTMLIVF